MRHESYTCDACGRVMTKEEYESLPVIGVEPPRKDRQGSGSFSPHLCGDCVGKVLAILGPHARDYAK
jgi:hypothetical protein